MKFQATIELARKAATGVTVPDEIVEALGGGNHPRVRVTLAGYSYQTSVARMGGQFKFPVSAAVREEAGVAAGDEVEVEIVLDTAPRELTVPDDLAELLDRDPAAKQVFEKLSYSNQKRHVLAIEDAKTPKTRQRRLAKVIAELRAKS